jgi:integrase
MNEQLLKQRLEPIENIQDQKWLDKVYRKSQSERSRFVAKTSLKCFDIFCQSQGVERHSDPDVTYGYIPKMVEQYLTLYNPKPNPNVLVRPDIRSICNSLDSFVGFMGENHDEIQLSENATFKKKSSKTTELYFGFVKTYLRQVHDVRVSTEDVGDYVTLPRKPKEPRKPVSLKQLKAILNTASPKRRALYSVLISSGMRVGESLSLTKQNLHLDESPVRVTINADNTKGKQGRDTYISSEAVEKLLPILEGVEDHVQFFSCRKDPAGDVSNEGKRFGSLRERLGVKNNDKRADKEHNGTGFFEMYPNSVRYVLNIHSMRAYFVTKASQINGSDYSHALSGHGAYLKQYIRIPEKEKAELYKKLEPHLFVESIRLQSDGVKDKEFAQMKEDMIALKEELERQRKYSQQTALT